ncbi:MAG: Nif3-like dinuclear metal center hexameric protein [Candidatus Aureabacteria bacterium]|nr:Nif3-like dinuclear metal center hexameric protein [Candidatus Auribacterota bacterium]
MKPKQLADFLNTYLEINKFKDYCPNGLQVDGGQSIKKIALGVSASLELFRKAKKINAQAVLVHHGLFWEKNPLPLVGVQGKRVQFLFRNQLSLMAYHLPLDAHPLIGNNASIANKLNLRNQKPFAEHHGMEIGIIGSLEQPLSFSVLSKKIQKIFGQVHAGFAFGSSQIKKVAIVSGGAAGDLYEAHLNRADLFLTGETEEPTQEWCREAGMNFMSVGHAVSEQFGVKNLGKIITDKFNIPCVFLPVYNYY